MSQLEKVRNPIQILLVEDDPEAVRTIWNMLHEKSRFHFDLEAVTRLPDALTHLVTQRVDVILLDLALATHQAEQDAVAAVQQAAPQAAVIVLTTLEDEKAGLAALELGADDYLLKEEMGTRALVRALHFAVERRRADIALSASEANYRLLAEISPDALLVSADGVYVYANPAVLRLFGARDGADVVGQAAVGFFDAAGTDITGELVQQALTRPTVVAAQKGSWKRQDGTAVAVEVAAAPLTWSGTPAVLLHVRDITEREQLAQRQAALLEQEHAARREAERSISLQRVFLGMVSHELRTPLAAIKGFSSSLLATDVTFTLEQMNEFIQIIDQEADRLTGLIEQLMDVVQVQAGAMRVEPGPALISTIVEGVMPQLLTLAVQHQLEIALPDTLLPVRADVRRMGQVVVNLVSNAVKFAPAGSTITLTADVQNGYVRFNVSDCGPGIAASEHQRVFEVFYQIASEGSRKPGSGLGLTICKGLVEAHGGTIWVADEPGPGTTVSFTLPVSTKTDG